MGKVVTIPRDKILRLRKGRGISRKVQKKLAAVDANDPDALVEVATWARDEGKKAKDGAILARRALVIDADHAEARAFLGHVKRLDLWYPDLDTANAALAERMAADGYVLHGEAWIKQEHLASIQSKPKEWMIDKVLYWRTVFDVMTERGYKLWDEVWYPPDELTLLPTLQRLKSGIEVTAHGAKDGSNKVYTSEGREIAQELAANLKVVREFFRETHDGERFKAQFGGIGSVWVLPDVESLHKYCTTFRRNMRIEEAMLEFSLKDGVVNFDVYQQVISIEKRDWENVVMARCGMGMMVSIWRGSFAMPDWVWMAAGHHGELAALGSIRIVYKQPDEYGRSDVEARKGSRGFDDLVDELKELKEKKAAPALRQLFAMKTNDMTGPGDTMGTVLMKFFFDEKKAEWIAYLNKVGSKYPAEHFKTSFGAEYETVEKEFWTWLKDQ